MVGVNDGGGTPTGWTGGVSVPRSLQLKCYSIYRCG